ncbi:Uncharacterized protein PBTT_07428 [Plasmodiophora brassicae]
MSIGDRIRRGAPSLVVVLAVVVLCGTTFGDDIFDVEAALAHLARISGKDQTMSVIASHVQCLIRGQAGGNIEFVNDGIYSHAKFDGTINLKAVQLRQGNCSFTACTRGRTRRLMMSMHDDLNVTGRLLASWQALSRPIGAVLPRLSSRKACQETPKSPRA